MARETPTWERAKQAIADGDQESATRLVDRCVSEWRSLQDYSINWITSLLSFIGREIGEDSVERALREFGEEFVLPRREGFAALTPAQRAKAITRAMLANFGSVDVDEDSEKITLTFRCGSGGRLVDEGRYDEQGGPYLTLRSAGPRTFGDDSLPVYCAHCSINNELQPMERGQLPTSVEHPTRQPGEPCIHHIYKDELPAQAYERLGLDRGAHRT